MLFILCCQRVFLGELGVEPIGRRRFRLANNEVIEREVGVVGIEVQGVRAHTIVVLEMKTYIYWV